MTMVLEPPSALLLVGGRPGPLYRGYLLILFDWGNFREVGPNLAYFCGAWLKFSLTYFYTDF